jgi:hypothetical protein
MDISMLKRPSAPLPLAMSVAALAIALGHIALPSEDDGSRNDPRGSYAIRPTEPEAKLMLFERKNAIIYGGIPDGLSYAVSGNMRCPTYSAERRLAADGETTYPPRLTRASGLSD